MGVVQPETEGVGGGHVGQAGPQVLVAGHPQLPAGVLRVPLLLHLYKSTSIIYK